jgi:hypothetical protein
VDQEVKRILDEAHGRAREVLEANRGLLQAIAEALLARETLDRKEVQALTRGETLPPLEGLPAPEPPDPLPRSQGGDGEGGGEGGDGGRGPGASLEGGDPVESGERSSASEAPSRVAGVDR